MTVTEGSPAPVPMARLEALLTDFRPAPVERWNPAHCGRIDIIIDRNGDWHHEGGRIERAALVRLFATVLRREADGTYVLVTPHEKLMITVEDAPFLAIDLVEDDRSRPPALVFATNIGEAVRLDCDHPLRVAGGGPDAPFIPYLTVRAGLEARLTRAVAADLADRAIVSDGRLGVMSAGQFFVIGDAGMATSA
ncbi:hypothetical protein SAMN02745157_1741 [Kaistia soli DSM 19436]|uniref:DUF1285 domain-containing protein n=2 Tax=Kaistia TaxID=166953 RepID=A0A1M4Z7T5_9HYPH|nr:hypothetical protein SAMN02745157_1741 [Kaistia soli DSM 19436]